MRNFLSLLFSLNRLFRFQRMKLNDRSYGKFRSCLFICVFMCCLSPFQENVQAQQTELIWPWTVWKDCGKWVKEGYDNAFITDLVFYSNKTMAVFFQFPFAEDCNGNRYNISSATFSSEIVSPDGIFKFAEAKYFFYYIEGNYNLPHMYFEPNSNLPSSFISNNIFISTFDTRESGVTWAKCNYGNSTINLTDIPNNSVFVLKLTGKFENGDDFSWIIGSIIKGNPLHAPIIISSKYNADGTFQVDTQIPEFDRLRDVGTFGDAEQNRIMVKPTGQASIIYDEKNGINVFPVNFSGSSVITLNAKRPKDKFNSDEKIDVSLFRKDKWYIGNSKASIEKFTPAYTIPSYPQPSELSVALDKGKVTLKWNMEQGTTSSPTDGYNLQWRRQGGTWATIPGVSKNYVRTETTCSVEFDYPEFNQGTRNYEFRVKRAGMNWDARDSKNELFESTKLVSINTDYINITDVSVKAENNGITLSWNLTEGIVKDGFKIRITRNGIGTNILTSSLDNNIKTFFDSNVPSCEKSEYKIEIIDGSTVIREVISEKVMRPDSDPGKIISLKVSKGFYNDRVLITWGLSANASFNSFTIYRKPLSNPDAIEQFVTEITATGLNTYSYEDKNAISGIYYTYIVRGYVKCSSDLPAVASSTSSTGFIQPLGVVSGRISYTGSAAVKDVNVVATGESGFKNKSLSLNDSLYVRIPYENVNSLSPTEFTFQAWYKSLEKSESIHARCLLNSMGRYWIRLYNTTADAGRLEITHYNKDGNGSNLNNNMTRVLFDNYTFPENEYHHITITSSVENGNLTAKLYIDGELKQTVETAFNGTPGAPSITNNPYTFIGTLTESGTVRDFASGYIDELRLWKKALTAEEIENNYDRYLSGQEEGLAMYYRFDEESGVEIFDISGRNGVFNENHGVIDGGNSAFRSEFETPVPDQLAIKASTNDNGYYLINTIPYTGNGTTFTITPMLGVHRFEPSNRPLYFSQSSSTHNNIDFTDVSSFEVSGTVFYESGNYPVVGCTFEVDGIQQVANNKPVTSDEYGNFMISVPIGEHKVQIKKNGHTFAGDGLLLENGKNINYNQNISGINFQDQTRVKLIGHIVGGKREDEKASGFGIRVNNIGSDVLKLTAVKEAYSFTKPAGSMTSTPIDTTFLHNTFDKWAKWNRPAGLNQDFTNMQIEDNVITIHVSPVTGEYVAWVYPEIYYVENISAGSSGIIYDYRETLDLSNSTVINDDMLQRSNYLWQDSVWVEPNGNILGHWRSENRTDTVRYHKEWGYFYQATPSYTVQQLVDKQSVNYFGDKEYKIDDETTVPLITDDDPPQYLFDKPIFTQGEEYKFGLAAFEQYSNSFTGQTDIVPVAGGEVYFTGELAMEPNPEPIILDSLGTGVYIFLGGMADLTTGEREMSTMIRIDGFPYNSDTFGSTGLSAYVLGGKSTGTDFMTAATDYVDFILHDPPGTSSYAYIEEGSVVTNTYTANLSEGISENFTALAVIGAENVTLAGLGVMTGGKAKVQVKLGGKLDFEASYKYNYTFETKTTFTDRIETSSEMDFVGHLADVYVGTGTNTLYGLTNNITINKTEEFGDPGDMLITKNNYAIGKQKALALGLQFGTAFAYTGYEIENIMIPKWQDALKNQFVFSESGIDPNTIPNSVYVSKLPANDPNFGKRNDDPVFKEQASTSAFNGPSYKIILPKALMDSLDFGKGNELGTIHITDSVAYFNDQIDQWKMILADNEKRKVDMKYEPGNNISFGSGVKIEKSQVWDTISTKNNGFSIKNNIFFVFENTIDILGSGLEIKNEIGFVGNEESMWGKTKENTHKVGFVLAETGLTDEISLDWGFDKNNMNGINTYMFRTRGGRTSCPYEGEIKTKYYEPGQHIISEATMQIEVPKIAVSGGVYRVQVPSSRPATFTLDLTNESETNAVGFYKLSVAESTNPDGAILKIDGTPIGNGRFFYVETGEVMKKTLTVEKGPNALSYENITLLFASNCNTNYMYLSDYYIYDSIRISVDFLPACSEVDIKYPSDNWIINTLTGDSILVELENYDINYNNFGYVELQYRSKSATQWNTEMKFYSNQDRYNNAQGEKTLLGTEPTIKYYWHKGQKPDGEYEFRAHTVCETSGGVFVSEYYTPALSGYVDMKPPVPLGFPSPANGILTAGDELSITFNENIQTGLLTQNNFSISGVLNAQTIEAPTVGLAFTGTQSAQTEFSIFANSSFSIETWFKRDVNTGGTLFAFGANDNYLSLGFNNAGNAVLKIGAETYTSSIAIANDATWKYIAMVYNRENNTITVYEFEGATNNILFMNQKLVDIPETQGKLIIGSNALNVLNALDGFNGAISQLHFYGINRLQEEVSSSMYLTKSNREFGLIGYWPLDEGEGSLAVDKARSRNLLLNNTDWYIYPAGYAKQTSGSNYLAIPTSSYPLSLFYDFTLEFWFRSETNNVSAGQTIFCADNGYLAINATGGLTLYKSDGTVIQDLNSQFPILNSQWHHVAMSVRRNGNVNIYIDGKNAAIFAESLLGSYASGYYYLGAKRTAPTTFDNYFAGYFDEIRIWNSALTRDAILLNKNSKLRGDEPGLQAYYPFETYTKQSNGVTAVFASDGNVANTDNNTAEGAAETSNIAVPVKDVRPVENVPFSFVASNNKIVFTLAPDKPEYFALIEGTTLTVSVSDVRDMRNNPSNTETWTAFVRRNPLLWDSEPVNVTMQQSETRTFTAKIMNTGGSTVNYIIVDLPSWLTVNNSAGSLQPLASRELTFSINKGINIGNYETAIGLSSGNGVVEILPLQLKVTGKGPGWSVNPDDFELSMSVTGQVRIEGTPQEDEDDLLAAFIGEKCVGLISPKYEPAYQSYFIFMSVWGNTGDDQKDVTFKFWDASAGQVYPVVDLIKNSNPFNLKFVGNDSHGIPDNPVIFNVRDFIEQSIAMVDGWNWISFNVENNNPALFDQFKINALSFGSQLKNGAGQFVNNSGTDWAGSLSSLTVTDAYLVKTTNEATLVATGKPVKPNETPITLLANRWSWIGYTPQFSLSVSEALAGISNPIPDEQIKGRTGYCIMSANNGWIGNLNVMEPGRGYMYRSYNTQNVTFNYPSVASTLRRGHIIQYESLGERYWKPDYYRFANSMTLTASLFMDGEEVIDGLFEIGAFCGNECRGSAILQYIDGFEHPFMGFLMIYGEESDPMIIKIFDHETGREYIANERFSFKTDAIYGTPDKTYPVSFKSLTGIETIDNAINLYPNPAEKYLYINHNRKILDMLMVTDLTGRTIMIEKDFIAESIDVSSLVSGVYILKIIDKEQTYAYRFIKK